MIKTGTDARRALPPALGLSVALSAMVFASRLPPTLDFILPRRAGWTLFASAFELLSRPYWRAAFTIAVTLLAAASLGRYLQLVGRAVRGRRWGLGGFLARGLRVAATLLLLRWSWFLWFELSQTVFFPYASLNPLEAPCNALVMTALLSAGGACVLSALSAEPSPAGRALLPWAGANLLASALAAGFFGVWWVDAPIRRVIERRSMFVVLTEEDGRPSQTGYDFPVEGSDDFMRDLERFVQYPGTQRLEELRFLYAERAKAMDPAGLRRDLLLGVAAGDGLARTVLLEHLLAAPPSPAALSALGTLADETAHRIGPMGASRLALAYARLGDRERAALWAKKAAEGPGGIPEGLLALPSGGALKPGVVTGRVEGLRPRVIGLYRHDEPSAPYLLDAAGLVAATEPDAKGRFSFAGLPAGRYYLALAFAAERTPRGEIRVSGHRGDFTLDARKTTLDLSPLTIKLTSR